MSKTFFIKREPCKHCNRSIEPYYESDKRYFAKMRKNVVMRAEVKQPRNPKHHALIHGLSICTLSNLPESNVWSRLYESNRQDTPHLFIKALQKEIGNTDVIRNLAGEVELIPKSMKFESMGEDEFEPISTAMYTVCAKMLKITVDELREHYKQYLG